MQLANPLPPAQSYTATYPIANGMPMVENVSCVFPQSQELGGLFMGNFLGAQNVDMLKERGIRAVLTTSIETPIKYATEHIPFHKCIEAHDRHNFSIGGHFQDCVDFIENCRKLTNVYVHCYAGVSRSASIVIAYIMKLYKWPYDATLNFLRHKRNIVHPNKGFATQLRQYEKKLNLNLKNSQISSKRSMQHAHPHSESDVMGSQINSGQLHHRHQRSLAAIAMGNTSRNVSANRRQGNSSSNNIGKSVSKTRNVPSLQTNAIRSAPEEQSKSGPNSSRQQQQAVVQHNRRSLNIEAFIPNAYYPKSSANIQRLSQNSLQSVSSSNNLTLQANKQSQQSYPSLKLFNIDRKINLKEQLQPPKISMVRKQVPNAYRAQPTTNNSNTVNPPSNSTFVSLKSSQERSNNISSSMGLICPKDLSGYRQQ